MLLGISFRVGFTEGSYCAAHGSCAPVSDVPSPCEIINLENNCDMTHSLTLLSVFFSWLIHTDLDDLPTSPPPTLTRPVQWPHSIVRWNTPKGNQSRNHEYEVHIWFDL